jgi:hypothetical protein
MNPTHPAKDSHRQASLVTWYMSPIALLLVVLGIVFGELEGRDQLMCIGLFIYSAFVNLVFPRFLAEQKAEKRSQDINSRLVQNLAINTALVYFLWPRFQPMWLILSLTPFATAVYGTLKRTLIVAGLTGGLLFLLHGLRGEPGAIGWFQVVTETAFIALLSPLIHGISRMSLETKQAETK